MHILYLEININKYNPLRASSFIELPLCIKRRNAVINIQNSDNKCFGWSVVAALIKPNGPRWNPSSYPHFSQVCNFSNIEFPVKLDSISTFEQNNNISINVYGLELIVYNNKKRYEIVGPLYFSKVKQNVHINLLLIEDNGKQHYCIIKDFSRLVSAQISNHRSRKYFCDGCLQNFSTKDLLERHCQHDCTRLYTKIPNTTLRKTRFEQTIPSNILQFENYQKKYKVPFVVYADFECLLMPLATCKPNFKTNTESFQLRTHLHQPYSCAYYIKCAFDDSLSFFKLFRGKTCVDDFLTSLEADVLDLYYKYLEPVKPMIPLLPEEEIDFQSAKTCHICEKKFTKTDIKVRDHLHTTGRFIGASHNSCNLNFKVPNFIPVFFHNLSNYDMHLFVKHLALHQEHIYVIGKTKEKYISLTKNLNVGSFQDKSGHSVQKQFKLRFVDTFRFLASSLETLAATLESHQCQEINKYFPLDKQFCLIRQKGVFPYSFVDDWNKLDVEKLPNKIDFFDKIKNEHISDELYKRAQLVWSIFGCKTLGDYSDIYLKSDVLLLCDIFENFRNSSLNAYGLDPAHYLTIPSLSWDAMLKYTQIELELLTDIDMLHFFKKGIRGGVSTCVKRMSKANNPMLNNYNFSDPLSYIVYLDATNLYGWAMKQYLPTGKFRWLHENEISTFSLSDISHTSEYGYVLEVDLEYPYNLHDYHNDLPFCPENIVPPNGKFPKLIPNLNNKSKYIIHYITLQQCLKHGLILKKIYRILTFKQSAWLEKYIDLNSKYRSEAKTKFDKDLRKLFNNSVFGKTMENVDKRIDIKIASHWSKETCKYGAETWLAKPNFKNFTIFSENLIAIEMNKVLVTYDKPIYVGFCILDLAKTVMYEFFYDFLKPKYQNNISLLYMDTDSLILETFTENIYDDIKQHSSRFDFSNFSKHNCHGIQPNVSIVGKMKDEYAGVPIKAFYGTGAKAYCVELNDRIDKKAKGVSKHIIQTTLQITDYQNVLINNVSVYCSMSIFKSYLHDIYTELRHKVALSAVDDKRFIIQGSNKTLAWGHYDIERQQNLNLLFELLKNI